MISVRWHAIEIYIIKSIFFSFSANDYWFYVPVVATHIGAILGSVMYDALVGLHLPDANAS